MPSVNVIGDVSIEAEATAGQEEAVNEVFRRAGFEVESHATIFRASADLKPWLVHVTVLVPLAAFFAAIGAQAGKDAYAVAKAWAKDMFEARKNSGLGRGSIVLHDLNGTQLILSSQWPDGAFDALPELDWAELEGGYLTWDETEGRWINQLSA